ncbi:MAG: aminotransferase class IV family protein [Blastocatellia bacterium]|nr:aminotransferase class IV family protein [Blastocatellia bacterium]
MHSFINQNGNIVAIEKSGISPANGGLLHGLGVFTTLRIYGGIPFLFQEHWNRLEANAKQLGLADVWTYPVVYDALMNLIEKNRFKEGKARITLLQSNSRFWKVPKYEFETDMLIFTSLLPHMSKTELALTVSPYRINSASPFAGVKVTNYLQQIMTIQEAEARDFDEAIVLNERAEVCEAAAANLFWVRAGIVYTPAVLTGCLPGVTRKAVLDLAHRLKLQVTEGAFHIEHLLSAEEVFLTSSTRELLQVCSINHHQFPSRLNSVYEQLYRAYKEKIRQSHNI